jgi:hypothetical protein
MSIIPVILMREMQKKRDSVTPSVTPLRHVLPIPPSGEITLSFRCPRCDRMGVQATGYVAVICEACAKAWGGK